MRAMTRRDRTLLTQGKLIEVVDDHHGNTIVESPLALFNAASCHNNLNDDGKFTVPEELDIAQVERLLSLMLKVAATSSVGDLTPTENTYIDLQSHSAAEALGMGSFTQSIFDLYFKRVNNHVAKVLTSKPSAPSIPRPATKYTSKWPTRSASRTSKTRSRIALTSSANSRLTCASTRP